MTKSDLKKAWISLLESNSFVLACHVRPDGDALGASLALARALRTLGKDVVVLSQDPVPENYTFLPDSETVATRADRRNYDVGMLIDSESLERVGNAADAVSGAGIKACIDHHQPIDQFGEIRVVDPQSSSTSEIIAELLFANDIVIDIETATQLLTGIIFDTGGFRYPNASPRTFDIASDLVERGASNAAIYREVFDNRPIRAMRLLGRALDSLETDTQSRLVWATISKSDFDEIGASDSDTEGIVNTVAAVKGLDVALLFREPEKDSIRVSLRSRGGVDVNRVAKVFGGGGHKAAAGCTVEAPIDEAKARVIGEVLRWTES